MNLFGGDWTEEKLDCVSAYLRAYTTALKHTPFQLHYIDAFAGTGYREISRDDDSGFLLLEEMIDEEPERFRKGSVTRALEVTPRFNQYYFIEKDPEKFLELQSLCCRYPAAATTAVNADANGYLLDLIEQQINWRSSRAVIFLDPFATEVAWPTLQAIAQYPGIDLWYLFPAMAVNRMPKWMDKSLHFGEQSSILCSVRTHGMNGSTHHTSNSRFGESRSQRFRSKRRLLS